MVTEKVETVEPETMSVDYACALLGIGRNLGYELARQGRLPGGLRLGRRVLVSKVLLFYEDLVSSVPEVNDGLSYHSQRRLLNVLKKVEVGF